MPEFEAHSYMAFFGRACTSWSLTEQCYYLPSLCFIACDACFPARLPALKRTAWLVIMHGSLRGAVIPHLSGKAFTARH